MGKKQKHGIPILLTSKKKYENKKKKLENN